MDHTQTLQAVSAIFWGSISIFLLPAGYRSLFGQPRLNDSWKSVTLVTSLLFIAFPTRALFWSDDVAGRQVLYYISMALAFYVATILWNNKAK